MLAREAFRANGLGPQQRNGFMTDRYPVSSA
jgi:hypothetical protein